MKIYGCHPSSLKISYIVLYYIVALCILMSPFQRWLWVVVLPPWTLYTSVCELSISRQAPCWFDLFWGCCCWACLFPEKVMRNLLEERRVFTSHCFNFLNKNFEDMVMGAPPDQVGQSYLENSYSPDICMRQSQR